MPDNNTRIYGLDTLRAIAICAVLMENYQWVAHDNIFGVMSKLGCVGVDLFFVLSGYLIGNQIFSALVKNQDFSIKQFYIRRALRTFPNYYVVLAFYFLFPGALSDNDHTASLFSYLTFTQNFYMSVDPAFNHSWSLCVEEQFYLVLPIIALLISLSTKSVRLGWLTIFMAMLIAIFIRAYTWHKYGQTNITAELFMEHIYYPSFTRFDGFLPGIAIAMLKNFHPNFFRNITKHGNVLLTTGIVLTTITLYMFHNFMYVPDRGFSLVMTSLGYSLLAISFSVLVLAALSQNSFLHRIAIPGAASLALWSYAIYLIHKPVFHILKTYLVQFGVDTNGNLAVAIILPTSVLGGWILYKTVEIPFMKLRAHYYPHNYK